MAGSCKPPVAERRPAKVSISFNGEQHDILHDPYSWLRDDSRSSKEVMDYLKAENSYAYAYFAALDPLVDALASDMDSRLPRTEVSQPNVHGNYIYYSKRGPGNEYWNYYRMPLPQFLGSTKDSSLPKNNSAAGCLNLAAAVRAAIDAAQKATGFATSDILASQTSSKAHNSRSNTAAGEQLVLDENTLSAQYKYWSVGEKAVSPDGLRIAFTCDTKGDEVYNLHVLDISTGKPLLAEPELGCAGAIIWWGHSSSMVCYTALDPKAPSRSKLLLKCLKLQQQQQQQQQQPDQRQQRPPQQQQQQHLSSERAALLYEPAEDETLISIAASSDDQYILLTSYVDGGTQVRALPTHYPLTFSSNNSSMSTYKGGSSSSTPIVPASAWITLITQEDDVGVHKVDHIGLIGSDSSSGSSSSRTFVAIVDDDRAPDGEVVLIHGTDSTAAPTMETIICNRVIKQEASDIHEDPQQHQQQQQQQSDIHEDPQQQQQQQSLEVLDFKVDSASGYMAVAVRRQGVCAVDIYKLQDNRNGSSSSSSDKQQQQQDSSNEAKKKLLHLESESCMMLVPQVTLVTTSSRSSSKNDGSGAASSSSSSDYVTLPNPAGSATSLKADLSWVLVMDDPTLVLDLEGLVGAEVLNHMGSTGVQNPHHSGSKGPGTQNPTGLAAPEPECWLLLHVSGITTPSALYFVNLATKEQFKVYQECVVGFEPACYTAKLEWATSSDGTEVPMTLAYRTELMKKDGANKALLQGYGAYGSKQWPSFNPADVALLDKGVVLAVAHVRGGGELGAAWHVHGKKFSKKNTFADFLACAHHLVTSHYTSRHLLAVWGRSAGGLTLGAALNVDPGFAGAAVLDVPFLDVLGTMRDAGLPLTIKERSEWGDPLNDQGAYTYIKEYSPYSNLQADAPYPALLLTASLHDTRVNFWEPAKYVAAVQHHKQQQQQAFTSSSSSSSAASATHDRPVLLLTDMNAGHFAASAAAARLEERAMKLAFILHNLEVQGC